MNHRQWKKNFKKVHGRNPNVHEDKKKAIKELGIILPAFREAMSEFISEMRNALGCLYETFGDGCIEIGKALKECGKAVRSD